MSDCPTPIVTHTDTVTDVVSTIEPSATVVTDLDVTAVTTVADPAMTVTGDTTVVDVVETAGPQGPEGVPGPAGPPGPPGLDGGDAFGPIVFDQASPSAMWHIVHGRGVDPSVVVRRADGQTIGGFGVDYPDVNTVDIYPGLIAGTATLTF